MDEKVVLLVEIKEYLRILKERGADVSPYDALDFEKASIEDLRSLRNSLKTLARTS